MNKHKCNLTDYWELTNIISQALQKYMKTKNCWHTIHFEPYKNGVKISIG